MSPYLPTAGSGGRRTPNSAAHGGRRGACATLVDDAEDGEVNTRRLDITSRWRKTCSCGPAAVSSARSWKRPLALWIDRAVMPKRGFWRKLPEHRRTRAVRPVRRRGRIGLCVRPLRRDLSPRSGDAGGDPAQPRQKRSARQSGPRRATAGGTYIVRAQAGARSR